MKRALSVAGCLAVLVVGLLPGHIAVAEQDDPCHQGTGPSTRQDDIYVKPRRRSPAPGELPPSCTTPPCIEWICMGDPCAQGRDDELRDDLLGDIMAFEFKGRELAEMRFEVSERTVTLTREGCSRFSWEFGDKRKQPKPCKHNQPNKTCKDDGIPGWLMGNLTGDIEVRYQGQATWVALQVDEEVYLKSCPRP